MRAHVGGSSPSIRQVQAIQAQAIRCKPCVPCSCVPPCSSPRRSPCRPPLPPAPTSSSISTSRRSAWRSRSIGQQRYIWPVSTGRAGYDTPNGTFKPNRMDADHFSQEWDNAPMPHTIFFDLHGHAIHGFFDVKHLGLPFRMVA